MVLSPDMAFFLGIHPRTDFTLKSLWELLDVRKRADDPEKCNQTLIETDHLKIWLFGKPLQDWTTVARVVFYLSAISSVLHLAAITVPRYRLKVGISLSQSEITAKQGQIKSWATRKKKKNPSTETKDVSGRKTDAKRATFTNMVSSAGVILIFCLHCPILLPSRVFRDKGRFYPKNRLKTKTVEVWVPSNCKKGQWVFITWVLTSNYSWLFQRDKSQAIDASQISKSRSPSSVEFVKWLQIQNYLIIVPLSRTQ